MSSRIEIELTSQRPDGTWTWRAAGAKEPKGTLDGSILYEGAKTGDIVRAEVVFEIDGINVEAVYPPKAKHTQSNIIELSSREPVSYLTRTVSGRERSRPGTERKPPRGDRRQPRIEQPGEARPSGRQPRRRPEEPAGRGTHAAAPAAAHAAERQQRRRAEKPGQPGPAPKQAAPKFKKLTPRNTYRSQVLQEIAPEHLPIAEQLLKGGLPAVRQALASQNEKAIAEGKPTIPEATVLAIAEPMLPVLKIATWKDRAEVAIEIANEASLRDLRSVISAADLIRHDDTTREMLEKLRELTEKRAATLHAAWLADIRENLQAKRVIRAVRLSSRPPEPIAKLPQEILEDLTNASNEMLGPETPADRWAALLDALSQSPIRRQVRPKGLPENAPLELIELAKESSGRIPALAQLLGIAIPPPPRPRKRIAPPDQKVEGAAKTSADAQPSGPSETVAETAQETSHQAVSETVAETAQETSSTSDE